MLTAAGGAWDQSIDSKCININILSYASGAISVVLDLIILGLPIPALLGLHMNTRKKIGLVLMFSVGTMFVFHPLSSSP